MIICADFDDTIYFGEESAKTIANLNAIKKWHSEGNIFILASNRSLGSLKRTLLNWQDYFDYLILDGGAKILNHNQELLHSNILNQSIITELLNILENSPTQPEVKFYSLDIEDYESTPSSAITKIYFHFQNQSDAEAFQAKITHIDINILSWQHVPSDYCIEITPQVTNKANALRQLINIANLQDSIATIGDNVNDYEMLTEFNGYTIVGSIISTLYPNLPTIPSVSALIADYSNC